MSSASAGNSQLSKEFFELVKSIGESKSKMEEDRIITNEIQVLRAAVGAKKVTTVRMKEYLIRAIYIEMLGHTAEFAHIHAIKMTHGGTLVQRRTGYLTCSLFLHPEHELMLLLVGGLQTDLQSDNHLEVATALVVLTKLVNRDTIPALLPIVSGKLLEHPQANVRKKAIMAVHRFYCLDPSAVPNIADMAKRALCDKNPSVMGSSLHLLCDLARAEPATFRDLVPSFVSILKQITEHRLPRDYDYHRMPAPWIQIKLLQILGFLGQDNPAASEGMYEVLHEVMRRADIGINVGYAIIYECVRTVAQICPNASLLEEAAKCTSRFITSEHHNLKYLGITALAGIVQANPKYAVEHQMVVIDCLEDPDETLRRNTLDLLFRMTNRGNVVVVVAKLVSRLADQTIVDEFFRQELVSKITALSETMAPSNEWYVQTMNTVFELGGPLVKDDVAYKVMQLMVDNAAKPSADGRTMGQYAADVYADLLDRPFLPDAMQQVISWVMGEFGHLASHLSVEQILDKLEAVLERPPRMGGADNRPWAMTAIAKLASRDVQGVGEVVAHRLARYQTSVSSDLQQRAHEFLELVKVPSTLQAAMGLDSSATLATEIDEELTFLDDYVQQALDAGAPPYKEDDLGLGDGGDGLEGGSAGHGASGGGLRFSAYAPAASMFETVQPVARKSSSGAADDNADGTGVTESGLRLRGPRKWGPEGYNGEDKAKADAEAAAAAAAAAADAASSILQPTPAQQSVSSFSPTAAAPAYSTTPAVAVAPAKPRVKTEKEKLADALFGGFGGGGEPEPPVVAAKPNPNRSSGGVGGDDLFAGMGVSSNPNPTPPAPVASSSSNDLLDLDSVFSAAPAPSASVSAAAASAAGLDAFDLIGGGGASSASSAAGAADLMMDFGSPSPASAATPAFNFDAAFPSCAARVRASVAAASTPSGKLGAPTPAFSVSFKCALERTQAICFLVVEPAGSLAAPAEILVDIASEGGCVRAAFEQGRDTAGGTTAPVSATRVRGVLQPGAPLVQPVLFASAAGLVSASAISVTVSCAGHKSAGKLAIAPRDLMRPYETTTQQFGTFWPKLPAEKKAVVAASPSVASSPAYMAAVARILNVHPVQTIGLENIAAGSVPVAGSQQAALVLVHAKVEGSKISLQVKSAKMEVSEAVLLALGTGLSS